MRMDVYCEGKKGGGMKRLLFLVFAFVLFVSNGWSLETVPSKISDVVLYPGSAMITREAQVVVPAGMNEIVIDSSVSRILDPDAISAKVLGNGVLYGVEFRRIYLDRYPSENLEALRKQVEQLQSDKDAINAKLKGLEEERSFLGELVRFASSEVKKDLKTALPTVEQVSPWLEFVRRKRAMIEQEKANLEMGLKEIEEKISTLQKQINDITYNRRKEKSVFVVRYEAKQKEEISVFVSYFVSSVSWQPVYVVRASSDSKEVDILMQAQVRQSTGEDWKDVGITISSITPVRGGALPMPLAWTLSLVQMESLVSTSMTTRRLINGISDSLGGRLEEGANSMDKAKAVVAGSTAKDLGIAVEYRLQGNSSVPSDGSSRLLPVRQWKESAVFYDYAVPKASNEVFLVCEISAKDFLPGNINVFLDGSFIGKSYAGSYKAKDKLRLLLGRDKSVKLVRELKSRKKQETIFGGINRPFIVESFVYEIDIVNLKDKPVSIKVYESTPVAQTDKIKVKNLVLNPKPDKKDVDSMPGVCLWEFRLPANGKKRIKESFSVSYPKGADVSGL